MSDNKDLDNSLVEDNLPEDDQRDSRYKRKRSDSESILDNGDGDEDVGQSEGDANYGNPGSGANATANQKKRKFSDKFSTDSGFFLKSETDESMVFDIVPTKVGHILGSKGMIILDLGKKSGAKIIINQDFPPGHHREVTISGTKEQMETAADLIKRIVELGPTAIHENSLKGGEVTTKWIECSQLQVGKVIGTGGANIKEIQSQSGARIQLHQNYPPEVPRKIEIVGTQPAIVTAEKLIRNLMNSAGAAHVPPPGGFQNGGNKPRYGQNTGGSFQYGNKPPYQAPYQAPPAAPAYGAPYGGAPPAAGPTPGETQHTMEVQKSFVARIIGKGAENLQKIQRLSGCRVYVDQNGPEGRPCKVNITGIPHNINLAVSLIHEIQAGVHTSKIGESLPPPIVGGAPPAGAPYGNPYGGAPYGAMPPPSSYPVDPYRGGASTGYGGYPQQPYPNPYASGGYEGYGNPQSYPRTSAPPASTAPPAGYGHPSPYSAPPATAAPSHAGYGYGAPAPAPAPAPVAPVVQPPKPATSEWSEHKTENGVPYWYNSRTGESQVNYLAHFYYIFMVEFMLFLHIL